MDSEHVDQVHGSGHLLTTLAGEPRRERTAYECENHAHGYKDSTQDRDDPMSFGISRPSIPEQPNGRAESAKDHGRKSILRFGISASLLAQPRGYHLRQNCVAEHANDRTNTQTQCSQASLTATEAVLFAEDDFEGGEA